MGYHKHVEFYKYSNYVTPVITIRLVHTGIYLMEQESRVTEWEKLMWNISINWYINYCSVVEIVVDYRELGH